MKAENESREQIQNRKIIDYYNEAQKYYYFLWHGNSLGLHYGFWSEDVKNRKEAILKENENGEDVAFIEAVGILNSYQGRGLGKNLIRAGLEFSMDSGFNNVMLSVNAENERAADLYVREGFKKEALIICYHLKFN